MHKTASQPFLVLATKWEADTTSLNAGLWSMKPWLPLTSWEGSFFIMQPQAEAMILPSF